MNTAEAAAALDRAAEILRAGGLVALPTETVYGLGANAFDAAAVARIFAAKQRPSWDPVIVHIADLEQLDGLVESVPEAARKLMDAYWPGPMTLLLPRSRAISDAVTSGRPLVGIRMPAHPVALELIRRAGVPVAAPSANLFSHTSPTTAAHVLADLDGRIDAIVDAGESLHGVESTVLDPGQTPMVIYRPGAVTAEQIRAVAGPVEFFRQPVTEETPHEALPSPGVGIRHYAPKARLILIEDCFAALSSRLVEEAKKHADARLGLMLPAEVVCPQELAGAEIFSWGCWARPAELAHGLYAGLRALDDRGCTVILCPLPPADGIGAAIADRLGKAARTK
jgi:L-threonylcarbamoyladenylate synthase